MSATTITIKTKKNTKKAAKMYFDSIGINLSTAINMFLNDVISNRSVHFNIWNTDIWSLQEVDFRDLSIQAYKNLQRVENLNEDDFHTLTEKDYVS